MVQIENADALAESVYTLKRLKLQDLLSTSCTDMACDIMFVVRLCALAGDFFFLVYVSKSFSELVSEYKVTLIKSKKSHQLASGWYFPVCNSTALQDVRSFCCVSLDSLFMHATLKLM